MTKKIEIIFGIHSVRHAVGSALHDILEVWIQDSKKDVEELIDIHNFITNAGITIQYVPRKSLDKITGNATHQGVALKRRTQTKHSGLDSILSRTVGPPPILLVLDGVQDPHNLGACLRTANATGVDAIVIPKNRAVQVNATVRKVASGAAEHTPVFPVTNLARTLTSMQDAGIWVIGTADDAETSLYAADLTGPLAIVLGAEGRGLRQNTRKHCDGLLKIPMLGSVESLNVSVAAGVCLYEIVRQRNVVISHK